MPFGGSLLGAAYFTGVKLIGYSAAGSFLNRRLETEAPHPIAFGAARTAIGVGFGIGYATLLSSWAIGRAEAWFLLGLIPLRVLEWLLVLWVFYRRAPTLDARRTGLVAAGVAWSFVLDIPAIFAMFVLPGGFWIC